MNFRKLNPSIEAIITHIKHMEQVKYGMEKMENKSELVLLINLTGWEFLR